MNIEGWVIVPRWEEFQHYSDRDPTWIKVYTRLVHDDDYLELSPTARALLHGIWALYALTNGQLRASSVQGALRMRATSQHWISLSDAGFIAISASKPLALTRARARSREEEKSKKREESAQERPSQNSYKPKQNASAEPAASATGPELIDYKAWLATLEEQADEDEVEW
jgi:hypothetical protein